MSDLIQILYDELDDVRQKLADLEEQSQNTRQMIITKLQELLPGGWEGQQAEMFNQEMEDTILPGHDRLSKSLFNASEVIMKVIQVFRESEEETAIYGDRPQTGPTPEGMAFPDVSSFVPGPAPVPINLPQTLPDLMKSIDTIKQIDADRFSIQIDGKTVILNREQADQIRIKARNAILSGLQVSKDRFDRAYDRYLDQGMIDREDVSNIVVSGIVGNPLSKALAEEALNQAGLTKDSAASKIGKAFREGRYSDAMAYLEEHDQATKLAEQAVHKYTGGIIESGEKVVDTLETVRDTAFTALDGMAVVAGPAGEWIATGARETARWGEAGMRAGLGEDVDWGETVTDSAISIGGQAILGGKGSATKGAPSLGISSKVRREVDELVELAAPQMNKGARGIYKTTAEASEQIWKQSEIKRGLAIEESLAKSQYKSWKNVGQYSGGSNPVIDFAKGDTVVSVKTINPYSKAYQKGHTFESLREHVEELSVSQWPELGTKVKRVLDVRVPQGTPKHVIDDLKGTLEDGIPDEMRSRMKISVSEF